MYTRHNPKVREKQFLLRLLHDRSENASYFFLEGFVFSISKEPLKILFLSKTSLMASEL